MLFELDLTTLKDLDAGRVNEAFKQAVQRCASDCEDRPAVTTARVVTIKLELKPVMQQEGAVLDSIDGKFSVADNAPKRETKPYNFAYRKKRDGGQLVFNDMSDNDVNQRTIDQE